MSSLYLSTQSLHTYTYSGQNGVHQNDHENFMGFFNQSQLRPWEIPELPLWPLGHFSYSVNMLYMHITLLQHLCIIYSSRIISILLVSSTWNQCAMISVMYSIFYMIFFL